MQRRANTLLILRASAYRARCPIGHVLGDRWGVYHLVTSTHTSARALALSVGVIQR